jgi:hypothetical protein
MRPLRIVEFARDLSSSLEMGYDQELKRVVSTSWERVGVVALTLGHL